jgi:uncharacterized protein
MCAPDIRSRLRRALTEALKARDAAAVSALRSALSAIGNAEAVDPGAVGPGAVGPGAGGSGRPGAPGSVHFAGAVAGLGAAEAERRLLTEADVAALVRAEAAERDAAASQYERSGHAGQAAGMRQGTRALLDALGDG